MKIRVCSDLHTEFWNTRKILFGENLRKHIEEILNEKVLPPLEDDRDTVLVLAGDIGAHLDLDSLYAFFDIVTTRFGDVFYVSGNHEFYGGDLAKEESWLNDLQDTYENLHTGIFIEEDTIIIGETLWTDYSNNDTGMKKLAEIFMNDYNRISYKEGKVNPDILYLKHEDSVRNIEISLSCPFLNSNTPKMIVVTHHAPSSKSISKEYLRSDLNPCYYTDLEDLISKYCPTLWIHGHVHSSFDYTIHKTRVLCNPFGYLNYDVNPSYDPNLVLDTEDI